MKLRALKMWNYSNALALDYKYSTKWDFRKEKNGEIDGKKKYVLGLKR